jgi:Predicted redox protein, regulator of disulfide bond formation
MRAEGAAMSETTGFRVSLERVDGYEYRVRFGERAIPDLTTDEAEPLGRGAGPTPSEMLAAAVGNCLAASLLFCLQKSRADVTGMRAVAEGTHVRNEKGRLRVGGIRVRLEVDGWIPRSCVAARALRGLLRRESEYRPGSSRRSRSGGGVK